jgi:translation initiation factor IF-3
MAHQELGARLLERVRTDLVEHGQVEQFPKMEGRQMVMVISPIKATEKPQKKPKQISE